MYKIMGKYKGRTEVLDETNDREDAEYLRGEYRLAYGQGWTIWIE